MARNVAEIHPQPPPLGVTRARFLPEAEDEFAEAVLFYERAAKFTASTLEPDRGALWPHRARDALHARRCKGAAGPAAQRDR